MEKHIREYWDYVAGHRVKIKVYPSNYKDIDPSVYVKCLPAMDLTVGEEKASPSKSKRKPNDDIATEREAFDE